MMRGRIVIFRNDLRLFGRQSLFSYRALVSWLNPRDYVLMRVLEPAFQIIFFALLGDFAGRPTSYFVVGNAVRLASVSGIYGCATVMGSERRSGTLQAIIASATPAWQTFIARSTMQIVDGLAPVIIGFALGGLFFDVDFGQVNWFWLAAALLVTSAAMSALGTSIGALGLIGTDINMVMNFVYAVLMVLCGVNFPVNQLPGAVQVISQLLPLTHGLQAVRHIFDGSLADVPGLIAVEAGIGATYLVAGYTAFRVAEHKARVLGTLDLV
ncbi:MAG: ABC transporter permease [Anaerolineae bacterium]|nr:ABC transporter permease [Anaerolineae bacterium]